MGSKYIDVIEQNMDFYNNWDGWISKSVKESKLEYFKRELIKIIDNQEVEVKKAFGVGKLSTYKDGSVWRKISSNPAKWKMVRGPKNYTEETQGAKIAAAKLKSKIRNATSYAELLQIVMANKNRFVDDKGNYLPIVKELMIEIENIHSKMKINNTNKMSEKEKEYINLYWIDSKKKYFTDETRSLALEKINHPTEKMLFVDYNRDNYNKYFPRGIVKTPLGVVKLGDHQFERLADKDKGLRKKYIGALYQTLTNPDVIIGKLDNRGRYGKLFLKAFTDDNGEKSYLSLVPTLDDINVVVSNGPRDTKDIAKEIKKTDHYYYIASRF